MKNIFSISAGLVLSVLFISGMAGSLWAQNTSVVSNSAGDEGTSGSLGWAVTNLNNLGAGTVDFQVPTDTVINLTQPLSSFSNVVTFQGSRVIIAGGDTGQSQLRFLQDFKQSSDFIFKNNGSLASGLGASVSAVNWTMDPNAVFNLLTANGPDGTAAGQDGGNASVSVSGWTVGLVSISAGEGGDATDLNGVAGDGGSVSVTGTSLVLPSHEFQINGGVGGGGNMNSGTNVAGMGGNASVAFASVSIGSGLQFNVYGGRGGDGMNGGDGGNANLSAGSVSLHSNLNVKGGNGGVGDGVNGTGGNASVSIGAYQGFAFSNLNVKGGDGKNWDFTAGNGGNAFYAGVSVVMTGVTSNFNVIGGNGANIGDSPGGPADGGDGGNAGVSLTSLSVGIDSIFIAQGGQGGSGTAGANPGGGGRGGDTSFSIGTFTIGDGTSMSINSGTGGAGGIADAGLTGGSGGTGGDLFVTVGTLDLGVASNLNLLGGAGANGGDVVSGGTGGAGGDGGNVSLVIGAVTMVSGNDLNITGGAAGIGGLAPGGSAGSVGSEGDASVSFGSLNGSGHVNVAGSTASLKVGSGDFVGNLSGSVALQKTGSGILKLSGNSTYTGGTTISSGDLEVHTGGNLGSGLVTNNSYLFYMDSATANGYAIQNNWSMYFNDNSSAGSSTITNDFRLYFSEDSNAGSANIINNNDMQISGNTSAGSATITTNSGGNTQFFGDTLGGTARFIVNSGGDFDISNHSAGTVTVGSIEGGGDFHLGNISLTTGVNNLSTTVTGIIDDGASLNSFTKIGTGILTLTGANTYSAYTFISEGTLAAGNAQALGIGIGTGVHVDGGTLMTVGAPLTIQVVGYYDQSSLGTLQLQLGGAGASASDAMNMSSYALLDGTLRLTDDGSLTSLPLGQSIVMMTTGAGVGGMFQNVVEILGQGRFLPKYLSNEVDLVSINPSFQTSGLTPNQKAIGADLDVLYGDARIYNLLMDPTMGLGVMSDPSFQAAADQASPAGLSSLFESGFGNTRSLALQVERRLAGLRRATVMMPVAAQAAGEIPADTTPAYSAPQASSPASSNAFLLGDGGTMNVTGDGNGPGYKVTSFGVGGAGVDFRPGTGLVAGVLLGYGHSDITVADGAALASDGGQLGVYGSMSKGRFYLWGMAEGGLNTYSTARAGYGGAASAKPSGIQYSAVLGGGYDWKFGQAILGPFAAFQYSAVSLDAFQEQGSLAPLSYPAQERTSLASRLGLRVGGRFKMGSVGLNPDLRVSWQNEFNDKGAAVDSGFGIGDSFTVAGAQIGQSGFQVGVSVEVLLESNLGFLAQYQGELGRNNMDSQRFGGGFQLGF